MKKKEKTKGQLVTILTGLPQKITEIEGSEKAPVESEEKYRTLFENTGTATVIIEEDTTLFMINTRFEKLSGYSKDEIENKKKWTDFVLPEDLERMKEYHIVRRKAGEKAPTEYEFRLIDKKGSIKDIFLKVAIIPGTKNSIASLIDITESKKIEKALKYSKEKFYSIFQNNLDAIVYTDNEGNVLDINSHFTKLFDYTLKEIKGRNINDGMIHPPDKIKEGNNLEKIALSRGYVNKRSIRKKKDGTLFPVLISGSLVMIDNQLKGILGLYQDITEQVQNEEKLQDYIKLIKKDRKNLKRLSKKLINAQEEERKKISEIIHDDIGQNITAIKINMSLIEGAIKSHTALKIKEILLETKPLLEQVFGQLHKLSVDLRSPILRDIGLVPALRQHVNRYQKRLNIEIKLEMINLEERLATEVETVIYRVVQEALTNISKHALASNIYLRLENKKSKVCILIEDNGKGFDIEDVRDSEDPDLGLGLLEMRERIDSIGGNLEIKSSSGKGTQLLIEISVR